MWNIRGNKLLRFTLLALDIVVAGAFVAHLVIASAAKGKTYSDVELIPHRRVGLLLGCPKRVADGRLNLFFLARVKAAAELYRHNKVDYLLASGDKSDDEPADFKNALISEGVPAGKIYLDYAGFRTLDSVVRARDVFGQTAITIISQEFQNQRAIFVANHSRLDAIAFNAPDLFSGRTLIRESLARVKAIFDIYLVRNQRRFVGATVAIGAGDEPDTSGAKAQQN